MKYVVNFKGYDIVISKIVVVTPISEDYPAKFSILLDGGIALDFKFESGLVPAHDEAKKVRAEFLDSIGLS